MARKADQRSPVALSDEEVAIGGGLSLDNVRMIMQMSRWDLIPFRDVVRFIQGCNFDPTAYQDRNRIKAYMRNGAKMRFLKKSPHWDSTFKPLILQHE